MNLSCPGPMVPHVQKVLRGEYDVRYEHPAPVILDIGANVGGFAVWALGRWPGCSLHCYEPLPETFDLLRKNLGHLAEGRVRLYHHAIGRPGRRRLYRGKNNPGEASFFDLGEQTGDWVEVEAISPEALPPAQVLKIDAEGAEGEVLSGLPAIDFDVVLLEYHSEANRRAADRLLDDYILCGGSVRSPHRGVLKYLRRRLLTGEETGAAMDLVTRPETG